MKSVIAILTNFMDFNPGYSLSGIVADQCFMLLRNEHDVHLFVNEQYNPAYNKDSRLEYLEENYPLTFHIHSKSKFIHLTDYRTIQNLSTEHKEAAEEAAAIYADLLIDFEVDTVFTHDFIYTGWNVPYGLAVKQASKDLEKRGYMVNWLHWIHSVPSAMSDWWYLNEYGPNHFIVFPNRTEQVRVADNFRTTPNRVIAIPHIKDIRTWYDFGEDAFHFTNVYPQMLSSEVVQVYPASTDRMSAKQVDIVVRIFGFLKKMNVSVFLLLANQWATGRQPRENMADVIRIALDAGLEYGVDFAISSLTPSMNHVSDFTTVEEILQDLKNEDEDSIKYPYSKGLSRRCLRELQLISNLLIFPTLEESFGLIGPETSFSGALPVINRSLTMMYEVMGNMCPAFDFGSHHCNHPPAKEDQYLQAVAVAILNRIYCDESLMTKTSLRARLNMDNLYDRYYRPVLLLEKIDPEDM
jgi:hypothetical protein